MARKRYQKGFVYLDVVRFCPQLSMAPGLAIM